MYTFFPLSDTNTLRHVGAEHLDPHIVYAHSIRVYFIGGNIKKHLCYAV